MAIQRSASRTNRMKFMVFLYEKGMNNGKIFDGRKIEKNRIELMA